MVEIHKLLLESRVSIILITTARTISIRRENFHDESNPFASYTLTGILKSVLFPG